MTSNHPDDDLVVIGQRPLLHTHGDWVAHARLGFIAPTAAAGGDALPINDIASNPAPRLTAAAPVAVGPAPHSVTANDRAAAPPGAWFKPVPMAVLSVAVAIALSGLAVALVANLGSRVDTPGPVITAALAAASFCGLVLIVAACMGVGGRQ